TLRKIEWGIFTSGGVGHIFGNHCIWQFAASSDSTCAVGQGWSSYLATPGATQFIYLKNFLSQYKWQLLVPDLSNTFLTAGMQTACTTRTAISACTRATAAVASDKSFAILYIPAAQNAVTVAMSGLNTNIVGTWYDPTTANTTSA